MGCRQPKQDRFKNQKRLFELPADAPVEVDAGGHEPAEPQVALLLAR